MTLPRCQPGSVQLQARPAEGGDWIDIYPAQLQWMAKEGHDVRALEVAPPMTSTLDDAREEISRIIYEAFPFDDAGQKPEWTPGGNSLRQDEARDAADKIIAFRAAPARCDADREILRDIVAKHQKCFMPCACLHNTQPSDCAALADAILKALVSPPSEAGREEIARIIDGVAFRPQHISGIGWTETEKEKWLRARNVAYYKADQIHALSPDQGTVAVASASQKSPCSHAAIISLDGMWHCQKCGDAIDMSVAISSTHHRTPGEVG